VQSIRRGRHGSIACGMASTTLSPVE
jgi:hypothetical protein